MKIAPARLIAALVTLPTLLAACSSSSSGPGDSPDGGGTFMPDGGSVDAPPACVPSGAPIMHTSSEITASETWASGIHIVPSTIHVKSTARLTIEGCSEVRLGVSASIIADATSSGVDANGTAGSPITFHRDGTTAWGYLEIITPATGKLAFTTFDGGGGTTAHGGGGDFEGATLVAKGDASKPTIPVVLTADNVAVTGSTGLGIFLQSARFDATSKQLTVKGAGWYPVYGGIASAASLPDGSYTGNNIDQILLQSVSAAVYDDNAALSMDATLLDRGVPYLVGTTPSSISVGSGRANDPPALLTIEANVTMLFKPQGTGGRSQLIVKGQTVDGKDLVQGALIVKGTAAKPVTFASAAAAPAPGDWQGLYFATLVDPRTSVANARILDGGGFSGTVGVCESAPGRGTNDASCAVVIAVSSPPTAFLKSSSIVDSANCAIYRDWHIANVDFVSSNTFTRVPGCTQTNVPDMNNLCPAAACPVAQ